MAEPTIAYLLKGYPRLSELFITSEISRLEQAGVALRLFVLRHPDEQTRHAVVDRINARPEYLPPVTSVSGTPFLAWLRSNLPTFLPALGRVARRRPRGLVRAFAAAGAQSVRARRSAWSLPRKKLGKELLQAVEVADMLLADPQIRHLHAHFAHSTHRERSSSSCSLIVDPTAMPISLSLSHYLFPRILSNSFFSFW